MRRIAGRDAEHAAEFQQPKRLGVCCDAPFSCMKRWASGFNSLSGWGFVATLAARALAIDTPVSTA